MVNAARGEDGEINASAASEGFVYMLNDGSRQADYKSPFADIIDGRKKVVWNGLSAAKGRNGSVNGISDEERAEGLAFIERQQARFPSEEEERLHMGFFRPSVTLQLDEPVREEGRILVHSGMRTRNRDWWTGKPYRLIPDGMRLKYFLKNPLVLWMHDFNIPLAKSDLFIDEGMLWATDDLQFHRRTIPIVATSPGFFGGGGAAVGEFDTSVIADLWESGFYNAVSVHVMFRPEDEENIHEFEEEVVAETSEVLEWSLVTMPGDPESGREEMVERMVHKGMRRDVAECIACGPGAFKVVGNQLVVPSHLLTTANSGGSVSVHPIPEVPKMNEKKVEEPAAVPAAEFTPLEQEGEVVQEVTIPAADLARFIAEDAEALHVLAEALIQHEGFVQALVERMSSEVLPATEQVAQLPNITFKFVSNGKVREESSRLQEGGPIVPSQPFLVGEHRPTVAQAAPAALPNANKPKKKGMFASMHRKP